GPAVEALGRRAGERLAAAGERAYDRGDVAVAATLFGVAADLPIIDILAETEIGLRLGRALQDCGRLPEARVRAEHCLANALGLDDRRMAARARILRLQILVADGTLDDLDPRAVEEAQE